MSPEQDQISPRGLAHWLIFAHLLLPNTPLPPLPPAARLPRLVPCELVETGAQSLTLAVLSRLCMDPVSAEKTILERKQAAITLGMVS